MYCTFKAFQSSAGRCLGFGFDEKMTEDQVFEGYLELKQSVGEEKMGTGFSCVCLLTEEQFKNQCVIK